MKKQGSLIFTFLLSLLLVNCGKDDIAPSHLVTLKIVYPDGFTAADFPGDVTVTATNTNTSRVTSVVATPNGTVTFELVEGTYNFNTVFSVTGDDNQEYTFNGAISNYSLLMESMVDMNLILADNTGGFIFKEIYYVSSKTPEGKSYSSDQFFEIYNNSGDTLYADGLCLAVLDHTTTSKLTVWVNEDGSLMERLPLAFHTWIVPGNGTDHPVYPGQNIVIAQDGINHITDENGNPNSPVDLSSADWETYVESSGKDLDASSVPNLTVVYTTSTIMADWVISTLGPAIVLFRFPNSWESYVADANNFMIKPGSSQSTEYMLIDRDYVIDAVELAKFDAPEIYKRLPAELDAGYTYVEAGPFSSKSVRRKAKMIVNGRVIYQDTNNSSVDFLHDLVPTPGVNPTVAEQ
ncbi:DUF4876 domain-containing protein [Maribellus sp. YY47]|uniref:DUF4876 domain-containing protein n=1 Tax=Maribellus sp. YY47 TaxID=2929486 RepID=UPI002000875A|nr:DUF4876 domain-containing protein [Maribellus sp. YY47]MCK3683397.1 DUF4876 domain-containing protein [Maribellus sp. YY47]